MSAGQRSDRLLRMSRRRAKPPAVKPLSTEVAIAIGSNLGDRAGNIAQAVRELANLDRSLLIDVSPTMEFEAVRTGPSDPGGAYLNAAAVLRTSLTPVQLLRRLQKIQKELGREPGSWGKGAARTLDLDLLIYGNKRVRTPSLEVPHPRMHERLFVLKPLVRIAPKMMHPVKKLSVEELLVLAMYRAGELQYVPSDERATGGPGAGRAEGGQAS